MRNETNFKLYTSIANTSVFPMICTLLFNLRFEISQVIQNQGHLQELLLRCFFEHSLFKIKFMKWRMQLQKNITNLCKDYWYKTFVVNLNQLARGTNSFLLTSICPLLVKIIWEIFGNGEHIWQLSIDEKMSLTQLYWVKCIKLLLPFGRCSMSGCWGRCYCRLGLGVTARYLVS